MLAAMKRPVRSALLVLLAPVVVLACMRERTHAMPAASTAAAPGKAPAAPSSPSTIAVDLVLAGDGGATAPPSASAAAPAAPPPIVEPALAGPDGKLLPETEDKPSTATPLFRHHVELLFKAIVADDPSIAMPFFFPVEAYNVVKDIEKPERDWKLRLVAHFKRDVHEYHQKLGVDPGHARLVGLDVPEERATWMKPGSEGNRIGYYRVLRAQLRYENAEGKARSLPITSLISWRGVWYVVHVHGFK